MESGFHEVSCVMRLHVSQAISDMSLHMLGFGAPPNVMHSASRATSSIMTIACEAVVLDVCRQRYAALMSNLVIRV